MTAGERAKNWAAALVTLWPIIVVLLGTTGFLNREAIHKFVGGEETLPIPDGQLITPEEDAANDVFRAQVRQSIQAINAAVNANTSAIESTRRYSGTLNDQTDLRVDQLEDMLNQSDATNFEALQLQMDTIKKLVN